MSGGFKEAGGEFVDLEKSVVDTAKKHGMRIIGPNCIGIYDSKTRLDTCFQSIERMLRPNTGGMSLITQSGTVGAAFMEWAAESGLGLSKMISYGNRADVDETDMVLHLARDQDTKVIVMYMESLGNPTQFLKAARATIPKKPVVVLKSGRTDVGGKAALSHTGSLAGAYQIAIAALEQAGVITVRDMDELYDVGKALYLQPLPNGRRVGMITNGAGPAVMATDLFTEHGVQVGGYSAETRDKLAKTLPSYALVGLVADLTGSATSEDYRKGIEGLLEDVNTDILIVFMVLQDTPLDEGILDVLAKAKQYDKPIICCAAGGPYTAKITKKLEDLGLPVYPTGERAARAALGLMSYAEVKERDFGDDVKDRPNQLGDLTAAKRILNEARSGGRTVLLESEAKSLLKCYGIPTTPEKVATDSEHAAAYADDLGYPVVLKISSPDIIHKTEAGGVLLNLASPEEVRVGFDKVVAKSRESNPKAKIEGLLVQKLIPEGREVVIGMIRDDRFGAVIMFGLGGVFVEVLKDVAFGIPPISRAVALEMIRKLRSFPALEAFRGKPPADVDAIVDILQRVSALVKDIDDIEEMDLNPLIVHERGAIAVDARVVLTPLQDVKSG